MLAQTLGDNDHGVFHGADFFEHGYDLGDRRALLANRNVDALHTQATLVDDRIERNGGLASLAVTNDQLSLATADRDQASIAFMPVCIGSCTGLRPMMPGAWTSICGSERPQVGPCRRLGYPVR